MSPRGGWGGTLRLRASAGSRLRIHAQREVREVRLCVHARPVRSRGETQSLGVTHPVPLGLDGGLGRVSLNPAKRKVAPLSFCRLCVPFHGAAFYARGGKW